MDIPVTISSVLNLSGSILLGFDLLAAPRRLREDSGFEKLRADADAHFRSIRFFVEFGQDPEPIEKLPLLRAIAVRQRGQWGIVLLILGFAVQLFASLFPCGS